MARSKQMIYIAHRGNLEGPNPRKENHPDYIKTALDAGFDVEIDVWFIDGKFILGHDEPQYEVEENFLYNGLFWQHAKNIEALHELLQISKFEDINCFFHGTDDYTLTSHGWIWAYPGKKIIGSGCVSSIAVMPERVPDWDISKAFGICTDFPKKYSIEFKAAT